jgi:hypothetical protein
MICGRQENRAFPTALFLYQPCLPVPLRGNMFKKIIKSALFFIGTFVGLSILFTIPVLFGGLNLVFESYTCILAIAAIGTGSIAFVGFIQIITGNKYGKEQISAEKDLGDFYIINTTTNHISDSNSNQDSNLW